MKLISIRHWRLLSLGLLSIGVGLWRVYIGSTTPLKLQNNLLFDPSHQIIKQSLAVAHKNKSLDLPILLYHYIEKATDSRDTVRKSLSLTPKIFEEQLVTLIANGYKPVTLTDVSNYFESGKALPNKPVILTFDDGYRDFYTDAFPILRHYHIPAVIFVVSGFLDTTKNYLTRQELLEISRSGLIEIGAHTVSHVNLLHLTNEKAQAEIRKSKADLENLLGRHIEQFAYPYGAYNETIAAEVKQAGFLSAATTKKGITQTYTDRFKLKRIRPGKLSGQALLYMLTHPT